MAIPSVRPRAGCSSGAARWKGFSLVEALIALVVATTAGLATSYLVVASAGSVRLAESQSKTALLAADRLEHLHALPWWFIDSAGGGLAPLSDATTNLGQEPAGTGGPGLSASPADALLHSASGYAEFLDRHGHSLGFIHPAPAGTAFVRRWSILPSPHDPENTLLLGVRVTPIAADLADGAHAGPLLLAGETWLFSLRTRTRP